MPYFVSIPFLRLLTCIWWDYMQGIATLFFLWLLIRLVILNFTSPDIAGWSRRCNDRVCMFW